jgi:hypothetical protein
MKGYFLIGLAMSMAYPLWADPADMPAIAQPPESAYLKKHEMNLEKMQTARNLDTENTRQAREVYLRDSAEMSGNAQRLSLDILNLKSLETQVSAGRTQKISKVDMDPLLASRVLLKQDIHQGGRLVHNEKVLLSVQKMDMNSKARYRAMDDRDIKKEEKIIAINRAAMTQVVRSSEPTGLPK